MKVKFFKKPVVYVSYASATGQNVRATVTVDMVS